MKKIITVIVIFVMSISFLEAKYGGSFLEIGVGARAVAMGGAYTAMAEDGYMFYWNPAALATLQNLSVVAQHAKLFNGLEHHNILGITQPIFGGNYISINWIRLSVPDIPLFYSDNLTIYGVNGWSRRMDEAQGTLDMLLEQNVALTDPALGYSDYNNDAIYLTFSKMNFFNIDFGWQYFVLPVEMPVGINFKIIKQSLFDYNASGIGMDLGWMFRFGFNDLFDKEYLGKFAMAVMLKDVWQTKLTWDNDTRHSDLIKRTFATGFSYWQPIKELNSSITISYDYHYQYQASHHFGMEYMLGEKIGLRFGLNDGNFTFGSGIKIWILKIDYAYVGHDLGNSHRIGLNIEL